MNEIVKYHNDFNKIKLPSFTEQEQNILMGIIAKIRETPNGEKITFYPQDLLELSTKNLTNRDLTEVINSFESKFFKADFKILLRDGDLIGLARINLFNEFVVWKHFKESFDTAKSDLDVWEELEKIELAVNPKFAYLINELTANFTRFELAEFIALSGKYTKTLYRLLKQYRTTGTRLFKWDEFLEIMDIPEDYRQIDIDTRILKPALKELTAERNLFDTKRIPFKDLKYTKLDKNQQPNPRGRNKVCFIKFEWEKEKVQELESKPKESKNTHPKEPNINAYCGVNVSIPVKEGDKVSRFEGKITNIGYAGDKITIAIKDESMRIRNLDFPNLEALEQCVKTYQI